MFKKLKFPLKKNFVFQSCEAELEQKYAKRAFL